MKIWIPVLCVVVGGILIGLAVWTDVFKRTAASPVEVSSTSPEVVERKVASVTPPIVRTPRTVTFSDGTEATFQLAEDFDIAVVAENLGKARFIAQSPDGRLFIPDMVNMNLSGEGSIYILDDFNEETHTFETITQYLTGLRGPNSVAFYTDKDGADWIYITTTDRLVRYPYRAGDMEPNGTPEVIATFPDYQSPTADNVVWHITRTLLFVDDVLYVSVGSGCNVCEQPEDEVRAVILAMDPEGTDIRVYADGIKNAVGMEWVDGALYATENGVDHLGDADPDDVLFKVSEGKHYGWPYCYEVDGVKYADTAVAWQREPVVCDTVPQSFVGFDPHSAPLGIRYFESAHPMLENTFLVALHGSFQPRIGNGYQLMRVTLDGKQDVFMDDFINEAGERAARPVDILQHDENAFFFTDDHGGRLFYVYAQ